ncbi:MAG: hypothetical protein K2Q28_02000 [Hyphomicrobium sp.]|nr:hypothetical protein [Hyphomicrobium sp.]
MSLPSERFLSPRGQIIGLLPSWCRSGSKRTTDILETPGRSVPWLEEDFNYEISGGLEPGESQDLRLAPNRFSKWGNQDLKKRNDLVLTLTLRDVEDAAGNRVAGSTDDTERKRERLKVLREKEGKLSRGEAI